jgi:hypothetical protein
MEGATYAQKTFGDVSNDLEKFEQIQTPTTPDTPTPPAEPIAPPATPDTPSAPAATTPPASPEPPASADVSDFNIGIDDDIPATSDSPTPPAGQFNFDEELKKIDKKELLKKAGVNDFAIEIDEFLSKGGNAIDYLNAKAIDYNKVSDETLIKSDLQKQYPTFTPQQIDLMFNRKYAVSEDASDEDKEFVSLQMKADAHNSRTTKIAEQQKFKIPETPILQKDEAYEQWKQQQASNSQVMGQYVAFHEGHAATKALNESKRVTINLGEGVAPFHFNIDKPQMITKALTDGGVILNKVTATPTGEPDVAKQHLITLFSFNPEKFIQDIFKYGQSMGVRKELVEEGQNAQRPQAIVTNMKNDGVQTVSVKKFGDVGR